MTVIGDCEPAASWAPRADDTDWAVAQSGPAARRAGAARELATMVAESRHPDLAATVTGDDTDWASWQQVLTEPWPILADAAAFAAKLGGLEGQITPGRWIA